MVLHICNIYVRYFWEAYIYVIIKLRDFYLLYKCYVQVKFCVQICIHVKFGFNFCVHICIHVKFGFNFCVQICIHVKFGFKYNEEISLFFECSSKFKRSKSICNNVVSISYCPNFEKTRNEVWTVYCPNFRTTKKKVWTNNGK